MSTLKTNNIQHVDRSDPSIIINTDGSVNIAGTMTYEDVTNVDAVGIITARTGIDIVAGELVIPESIVHRGDTNTKIIFAANDTITAQTSGSERLRIDSDGRFLVGQTSGSSKLCVSSISEPVVAQLHHSDGGTNDQARIVLGALANNPPANRGASLIAENNGNGHDFIVACSATHNAGPSEKFRITSAGKVGIGTDNPHVTGLTLSGASTRIQLISPTTGGASGDGVIFGLNGDQDFFINNRETSKNLLFFTENTQRLTIDSSGRLLLATTTEGHANADELTIADTDHCGITIRSATNKNGSVFFSDGTSGDAEYRGWVQYTHTSDYLTFATSAAERIRINSNGQVLLGTTTNPAFSNRRLTVATTSGTTGIEIRSATDGDGRIIFTDSVDSSNTGAYKCQIKYLQSSDDFTISSNGDNERLRIVSNGEVGINVTNPETYGISGTGYGGLTVQAPSGGYSGITIRSSYAGAGALFFADGNGTNAERKNLGFIADHVNKRMNFLVDGAGSFRMTQYGLHPNPSDAAETTALDDYEEGTFTGGINDFNGTYSHRTGTYTKIGNVVTIQIMISGSGGSGSGSLILTSLPFNSDSSSANYRAVGAIHAHRGLVTGGVQVIGLMNNNENKIRVRTVQNNATTTDLNRNGLNSGGWELVFGMVYHTAA